MCIDVCRGGEGTVTQPDLDLLHGDTVAEKQAGAGVTKIMEANLAKPILLDEPREMLRCIVRTQKFSALVNADVVEVVPAVTFFEESPVHLLLLFLLQQDDSYCWNQRECSEAGFGFQDILAPRDELSIHLCFDDLVADGDRLVFHVDGAPPQSENFASPQAIVCCYALIVPCMRIADRLRPIFQTGTAGIRSPRSPFFHRGRSAGLRC